jgi:prolyl-tRNA editing enzyme YbaK/EbsC (Cys-tRNA(Pro) deacylase)
MLRAIPSGTAMPELSPSVQRVKNAASAYGLSIEIHEVPQSTRTAAEAAAAVGTTVGQIVKSLIFRGKQSGRPYLILVSGSNRVNEDAVAAVIGEAVARPDAAYVRETTGFAIGGIPPFGFASRMHSYFDEDLLQYETVWAAAGTPHAVFAVAPSALRDAIDAKVMRVG